MKKNLEAFHHSIPQHFKVRKPFFLLLSGRSHRVIPHVTILRGVSRTMTHVPKGEKGRVHWDDREYPLCGSPAVGPWNWIDPMTGGQTTENQRNVSTALSPAWMQPVISCCPLVHISCWSCFSGAKGRGPVRAQASSDPHLEGGVADSSAVPDSQVLLIRGLLWGAEAEPSLSNSCLCAKWHQS